MKTDFQESFRGLPRIHFVDEVRVGIFKAEMDDLEVGNRLGRLYPTDNFPDGLVLSDDELLREFRKRHSLGSEVRMPR
jgi:hypothetical protein